MPPVEPSSNRYGYWRSLGELSNSPEFQESQRLEFIGGVPDDVKGVSRRRFMQIMSASIALAGGAGCRWPKQEILPEVTRPEDFMPGVPRYYATAMELSGVAQPLLAKSVDGRPIKVDGNPDHPATQTRAGKYALGASNTFSQASTLGLYDPDRLTTVLNKANASTWEAFQSFVGTLFGQLRDVRGAKLRVLSEASSSATLLSLKRQFLEAFPEAKWFEYEPLSRDAEAAGTRLAFGKAYRAHYALDKAEVVLALDADLFGTHPAAVQYSRDFAKGRNPDGGAMSRLYAIESNFTPTGAAADNRLPWRASDMLKLLLSLEGKLLSESTVRGKTNGVTAVAGGVSYVAGNAKAEAFLSAVVADLASHLGKCVIAVGEGQPAEVHAVAHRLNVILGAVPTCVEYLVVDEADRPSHTEAIKTLTDEMKAGGVETLLILGGNPVYDAPVDFDFAAGLGKVANAIHLTEHRNETSRAAGVTWVLPKANYLESWGDPKAFDGSLCITQPLIAPLWGGKSAIEVLALILGGEGPKDGLALVRANYNTIVTEGNQDDLWAAAVHQGFQPNTRYPSERPTPAAGWNPTVPAEWNAASAP
ncbi:MAG TPA: TAT-variant-translocated molybdopterin oxidoreductase, partial [Pirellulales bacterium]